MNKKRISLVLGSGGARGLAHIGVIRWLIEHNYEIKSISGCSIGALIGGFHALGKLNIFEEWICGMSRLERFRLLDVSWKSGGLIHGDKIMSKLIELGGDQKIETLSIPYTAVAVDLVNGKEVWMDKGSLFEAIRASISLPLIFKPAIRNGRQMIDGGCLNPVPVSPTFKDISLKDKIDFTIAVNLNGTVDENVIPNNQRRRRSTDQLLTIEEKENYKKENKQKENKQKEIKKSKDDKDSLFYNSLSKVSQTVVNYTSKFSSNKTNRLSNDIGFSEVANQAFDAMQSVIARHKLAAYPPDYVVEVARNVRSTLNFECAEEMIDLGYKRAEECLREITI